MRRGWLFALALLAIEPAAVAGQTSGEDDRNQDIVVTGISNQFRLTGKQLAAAAESFASHRALLAPDSRLYFRVEVDRRINAGYPVLSLVTGDQRDTLSLDDGHRFQLPADVSAASTLYANRSRGTIIVIPEVFSPGTSDTDRRLGDLRLQCHVFWAISGPMVSLVARGMFAAAGGCGGTKFAFYSLSPKPIGDVRAIFDGRELPLRRWGARNFQVPVGDRSLGNDARIRLSYQ